MQALEKELARFEQVSLKDLNKRARLTTRIDRKYVIPRQDFLRVLSSIQNTHDLLKIKGRTSFTYESLYFDTPLRNFYHDHLRGKHKRYKIRIRTYLDSGLRKIEIKTKSPHGYTVKKSLKCVDNQLDTKARAFLAEVLLDKYGFELPLDLQPVLTTRHKRITFAAKKGKQRLTCDLNLELLNGHAKAMMKDDYVILETKTEDGQGEVDQLLVSLGYMSQACSKYCLGIMHLERGLRRNRFFSLAKNAFCFPKK